MTSDPGPTTIGDLPECETTRTSDVYGTDELGVTETVASVIEERGRSRPLTRCRPEPSAPSGNRPVVGNVTTVSGDVDAGVGVIT